MPSFGPTELIIIGFVLLIVAAVVLTVLRALSPSPERCLKILRRWGLEQPSKEQAGLLAGFFRSRRRVYLPVLVVVGVAVSLLGDSDWILIGLTTVLASLLVIELGALVRPAFRGRRSAALIRRGVTDLVPPFALLSYGLVAAIGLASIVINLLTMHWGTDIRRPWVLPLGYVVFAAAAGATVWCSLVRAPLFEDSVVDAALRIRSARVATGVSLLLLSFLSIGALLGTDYRPTMPHWISVADGAGISLAVLVLAIDLVNWVALLNPIRKQRLVEASR
jgi:hypothetical protein